MPQVLLESRDTVRVITLNAPERLNSLDLDLLAEMAQAVQAVQADTDAAALVVTGAGRGFSAGANLANMFGDTTRPTEQMREHLMGVYNSFLGLRDLTIPTIAAVNGAAVGAGLNIALCCDVIVCGPKAKFGATFAEIGLHPGGGCSWLLTERLGRARTAAILLAAEPIDADEAWRIGLCDVRANDALDAATTLAERYAARDPHLNATIKHSAQIAANSDFATSLAFESQAQAESVRSPRFQQYLADFASR